MTDLRNVSSEIDWGSDDASAALVSRRRAGSIAGWSRNR